MPDSNLPRWARIVGKCLAFSAYLFCVVVAVADAWFPAPTISGALHPAQINFSVVGMAVGGTVGAVAVLCHRWRWEWVSASALAFLLLARSVPVWSSVHAVPYRLAAASMTIVAAIALGRRALDMWTFAVKTGALARRHRQLKESS